MLGLRIPVWRRRPGGIAATGGQNSPSVAGPITRILDQFTDVDTTVLASHTIAPTNVPATSWAVLVIGGGGLIQSNALWLSSSGAGAWALDTGVTDMDVTLTGTLGAADVNHSIQIITRVLDASNYWLTRLYNDRLSIFDVVATVATERAGGAVVSDTSPHAFRALWAGNVVTFTYDGGNLLTYTSSFNNTQTKAGLQQYTNSGVADVIDNFQVVG